MMLLLLLTLIYSASSQSWNNGWQQVPSPSQGSWQTPSQNPSPTSWSNNNPAPNPSPTSWSAPSPSPASWSAPSPSPASWSAPSPSPASWSAPSPSPSSWSAPSPSPASWSAPSPSPNVWSHQNPSPTVWVAPSPSPSVWSPSPGSSNVFVVPNPAPSPSTNQHQSIIWPNPSSNTPTSSVSKVVVIPGGYGSGSQAPSQVIYKLTGMHVPGGWLVRGVNDLFYCLHACAKNITCIGFDFNSVDKTCWFHNMTTVCNTPVAKADCTNYKFDPCPSTSTASMTTTTPTAAATSPPVGFPMMHALGGAIQVGISTITDCVDRCRALGVARCVAVDFDVSSNTCWIHTIATCRNLEAKIQCTHIRIAACP